MKSVVAMCPAFASVLDRVSSADDGVDFFERFSVSLKNSG